MADTEHLAILNQGVDAWNRWRSESQEKPNLSDANLDGATLDGANFGHADLRKANFSNTNLIGAQLNDANLGNALLAQADLNNANVSAANLEDADLSGADLTTARLRDANLQRTFLTNATLHLTDLSGADLRDAIFVGASFYDAVLLGANFSRARMWMTRIADTDLSAACGLEDVQHIGPSSISVDAIYKSKGGIPESFLRGCGVPDNLIRYLPSLLNSEDGIQFYSCFISYSSKDEQFARRLHGRMRDGHLRVWFAPEDIQGGKKLHEQIETAIRVYDKLLIVLSEASLQSEWVITELRKARKAERQSRKRKLFPVRLVDFETLRGWECFDADSSNDLAVELREYFIPDFSNWKNHDSFETEFERLLKDLRANPNGA